MKKWVVFLLILLALIGIFLIDLEVSNNIKSDDNNANTNDDKTTGEVVKDNPEIDGISGNAVGGGGSGGGSGSSSGGAGGSSGSENNPETSPGRELPSDLNTRPCGFYFTEYNVCAGVCPGGQCLIDGKSCYCRIV
ncbi:MAG: hypothetical protein Q8N63_08800 [Nanoarchaeota archaeon]|nr:hypothetical protein [Nanoarchaeota archaeon]